jgi:hypothetical protein
VCFGVPSWLPSFFISKEGCPKGGVVVPCAFILILAALKLSINPIKPGGLDYMMFGKWRILKKTYGKKLLNNHPGLRPPLLEKAGSFWFS